MFPQSGAHTILEAQDDRFEGYSTLCAETLCCRYPFADADCDGDVDAFDFVEFMNCYTGANVPYDDVINLLNCNP